MTSDWQSMRASDADRQRAADVLKAAVAEGRLTPAEHAARLDRVLATRTYGELQQVVSDLPTGATPFGMPPPPQQPHPQPTLYAHPPAQWPPPMPPARPVNGLTTASLLLGIFGFMTAGLTSIPAVVTGHLGLNRIRSTHEGGEVRGRVGLALGYVGIILLVVRVVTFIGFGS